MVNSFDDLTLRNLSDIVSNMLTHKKISELLKSKSINDTGEGTNKSDKIYYSIKAKQKQDNCGNNILDLITYLLNPKRYSDELEYEKDRTLINEKLLFEGIEINKEGKANKVDKAKTISESKERSKKIKQKIQGIQIHPEITRFCEEEWLKDNYFHAILEITKSIAHELRQKSGSILDGGELIDVCFGLGKDKKPLLAFNTLQSISEESEHKGFSNFCKGFFSMYRNPKAHNPKILEDTQLAEMIEVLVISTIIFKKLDKTFRTGYK